MSENKSGDVKNIGDAGDSTRDSLEMPEVMCGSPVCEMVRGIKRALQCGDHQGLKILLGKLETWRQDGKTDLLHDYWRVAQYVGETEIHNIYILLSVTCDKPDSVKWDYLSDALSVLALCLCNREIIFKLLVYVNNITSILVMALDQDSNEEAAIQALTVINVTVTVCRARFAKGLLSVNFLDKLVHRLVEQGSPKVLYLFEMVLEVIKSLLMCGQSYIHLYAVEVLKKLSPVAAAMSASQNPDDEEKQQDGLVEFYNELLWSADIDEKPHVCAKYWTRGRLRKDLLSRCLKQQWLYIYCSWPVCGNHNGISSTFFRKCSACLMVRYCSRQCQEKHWEAGHNIQCKLICGLGKSV
ncbi:unnamed protein product [Candidula unifasciata]|uniref:MYND-type domain-containing protein n=1 Tax=Candidula unifasciata TaxID=100452 RepID=A0A8S3ZDP7_9EUPU|nr:unnamed protein product [Candidula unifasciata]